MEEIQYIQDVKEAEDKELEAQAGNTGLNDH